MTTGINLDGIPDSYRVLSCCPSCKYVRVIRLDLVNESSARRMFVCTLGSFKAPPARGGSAELLTWQARCVAENGVCDFWTKRD